MYMSYILGASALSLIIRGLTPFFSHITTGMSLIHVFPGSLTPILHAAVFPSNCLLGEDESRLSH